MAAYRRAVELNPADAVARADLAILLEHDADGVRYQAGADLPGAIAEYRYIHEKLGNTSMDANLLVALTRAGRFQELREFALALAPSENRSYHLILAAAVLEGGAAGVAESRPLISDPAQRRSTIEGVAASLAQQRLYAVSADLVAEAAQGSSNAAALRNRETLLRAITRFDQIQLPEDDPVSVARRAMIAMFVPGAAGETLGSLFSREVTRWLEEQDGENAVGALDRTIGKLLQNMVKTTAGMTPEVAADLGIGSFEFRVEGDAARAYRIKARQPLVPGGVTVVFYAVREEGGLRMVSVSSGGSGAPLLAVMALGCVERGEIESARRWLDWTAQELPKSGGRDLADRIPFAALWSVGQQGDAGQIRTAAAALLAWSGGDGKRLAPILREARGAATTDEARIDIDLALLALSTRQKDMGEVNAACGRLEALHADARFLLGAKLRALSLVQDREAAAALVESWLAAHPRDPFGLRMVADLAAGSGDLKKREDAYRALVQDGTAQSADYNNLAWLGLFRDRVLPEDVKNGEVAVNLSRGRSTASLHTLAALYAETGKTAEARDMILKTMQGGEHESPRPADWYVLGRIAEEYGELEAAAEAYRKVTPAESEILRSVDTVVLARRRLAAIAP